MTQPDKANQTPESEKEVRKLNPLSHFSSKLSPSYWTAKVFRPTYSKDGESREVLEFYCQIQHAGRREKLALATNSKEEAARKAAKLFSRIKSAGWEIALAEFDPDRAGARNSPTVGEYILAVTKAVDVSPRSLQKYVACLRLIVAEAFGIKIDNSRFDYVNGGLAAYHQRVDRVKLEKLTPDRVQAVLHARIALAHGNPLAEQKARVTAASALRQAKALFRSDLKLPFKTTANPFQGVKVKVGSPRKYSSAIDAGALMRAGRDELAKAQPESYKALLLALGAGLRKNEIDNLQWQQIDFDQSLVRIRTTDTFSAKTDSSEGDVFVDPGLIAMLKPFKDEAKSLYVLESEFQPKPGATFCYYRAAATFDKLTAWLRSKGVMANKPLHELRKEFGSIITASADIHTASRQLRHASIQTTANYYADSRRRVAPPIGAMLSGQQTAQKGQL